MEISTHSTLSKEPDSEMAYHNNFAAMSKLRQDPRFQRVDEDSKYSVGRRLYKAYAYFQPDSSQTFDKEESRLLWKHLKYIEAAYFAMDVKDTLDGSRDITNRLQVQVNHSLQKLSENFCELYDPDVLVAMGPQCLEE